MNVVIISKEKYDEMVGKLNRLSDWVNEILRKREGKRLSRWMDNQEVCQQLRISPRTLQTLRDNGTLAYSQIGHKIFYKPEDVQRSDLWRTDAKMPHGVVKAFNLMTNV